MPPSSLALHEQEPAQTVAPSAKACPFAEGHDEKNQNKDHNLSQQRRHQRQLDRFASRCRMYYELSTSVHSTGSPGAGGHSDEGSSNRNGQKQDTTCPTRQHSKCRAVLEAFDECCRRAHAYQQHASNDRIESSPQPSPTSTLTEDPSNYDAVRECGLDDPAAFVVDSSASSSDDPSSSLMLSYVRIRDAERNRAHVVQMLVRRRALLSLLRRTESAEEGRRMDDEAMTAAAVSEGDTTPAALRCFRGRHREEEEFRRNRDRLRVFVTKYKNRVGSHSFMAGLRRLLESQVGEDKMFEWTFDGAVLTDNCHGSLVGRGKEGGGGGDDAYAEDAVELLTRLFVRNKSDDEEEQAKEKGTEEGCEDLTCPPLTLRYEIQHSLNDGQLRQLAHLLPPERELHCKPTGTLALTNEERRQHNIDKGLDAKCLEWCSLVLLRWRL